MEQGKWRPWPRIFGPNAEREVEEELSFHIEMRIAELVEAGEDPARARELTLARFGDVSAPRAECVAINERKGRRMARTEYVTELKQDIVYAVRALRRRPAFSFVAIATLALGIGANSAIFSVVYGVLLKTLPFAEGDRLVVVKTAYPDGNAYELSAADFMSVVQDNRAFDGVIAEATGSVTMTGRGEPREVSRAALSKGFFELLGVKPVAGRLFTESEHIPNGERVAMVSEGFAAELFGGPRQALNQSLTLAGNPYTIVGVMPAGTELPEDVRLYVPIRYDTTFSATTQAQRRSEFLNVIARRRSAVDVSAAEADVKRVGAALQTQFPTTNATLTLRATPLSEELTGPVRQPLLILLGAVGLVLLIACANVANLLLARATTRESELAVRAALGAGRGRLVRQLLTESIVLSVSGAMLGLLLAWWGTRALTTSSAIPIPRLANIGINNTVVIFTMVLSLITGLLFGALPALQGTGTRLMHSLREGGRGALSGVRGQRIRAAFVIAELALAVILLMGAGLLIRSFVEMTQVNPGFHPENAIAFRLSLQGDKYQQPASRTQFFTELDQRLRSMPGVTEVGGTTTLPMTGGASLIGPFQAEGRDVPPGVISEIRYVTVTPTYFDAIGARLLRGRRFDSRDRGDSSATAVGIVNRATIARWFPDGDPVGERVLVGGSPVEIVGVIDDVLQRSPTTTIQPEMYVPYVQQPLRTLRMVVRGDGDMTVNSSRVRAEVRAIDPLLPIETIQSLESVADAALAGPRFYMTLMALFAVMAVTLAVVGIFGVMSYVVAQRSREISVRMALGASKARVVGMVVGSAMRVTTAGLVLGLAGAMAGAGVLRSQLFGVGAADPLTMAAVLAVLAGSAGVASFLPRGRHHNDARA
jgi:predicted permease